MKTAGSDCPYGFSIFLLLGCKKSFGAVTLEDLFMAHEGEKNVMETSFVPLKKSTVSHHVAL